MFGTNRNVISRFTASLIILTTLLFYASNLRSQNLRNASIDQKQKWQCSIILRERSGRLGNRLFMFATAVGLSITYSCRLEVSAEIINELNQSFEIDLQHFVVKSEVDFSEPAQKVYNHCSYISQLFTSNLPRKLELTGYWQVHTYFSIHAVEIRRQLRFKSTLLDRAKRFLHRTSSSNISARVGIHIRRGDFLRGRYVSSNEFIANAMSYFTRKYHSVLFVVITDDRPYCENLFSRRKDVLYTPASFDAGTDLATLSECDHAIITVGTYGWWGAFLLHNRTGEVITDAKPDFTPIDVNCQGNLYFPSWFSFLSKSS